MHDRMHHQPFARLALFQAVVQQRLALRMAWKCARRTLQQVLCPAEESGDNLATSRGSLRGHVDRNVHAQSVGHIDQSVQAKIADLSS